MFFFLAVFPEVSEISLLSLLFSLFFSFFCFRIVWRDVRLEVAVDVGAGIGVMSAMAVAHGKLREVHAVEAPSK